MPKKTGKNSKSFAIKRVLVPSVLAILVVAAIVQSLLIAYLLYQNRILDNARISSLIQQAADGLNQPVSKDPRSGEVFISEARLTLPPVPAQLGQIVYSYSGPYANFQPFLRLARQNSISSSASQLLAGGASVEKTFSAVPKMQACTRGITVSYADYAEQTGQPGPTAAGKKVLSNGKTVYFFTEPLCPEPDLLKYAKQIDSYAG
jgi:hypothetical protein